MTAHRVTAHGLDWEDVRALTALGAGRTVRAAALALGVHHATVIRRIARLEDAVGARLCERRPEGYALTSAAEKIVGAAREFAEALTDVEREIAGADDALTGVVTLTMAEPLAVVLFAPRLTEFEAAFPGLELRLRTSMNFLDLARLEADVAVRMDDNPPETLVGKRVFAYRDTIYASPAYLEAHDLGAAPEAGRWLGWRAEDGRFPEWTQRTEFARVPVRGVFPDLNVQRAAAAAGLGLAILPCLLGDADPDLARATARPPTPSRDIWILTHADLRRTARVRATMGFAERVLRENAARLIGDLSATG